MNDFRDIYYKVGIKLAEEHFDFRTTEEQKELVDKHLKNYLLEKLSEVTKTSTFIDSTNEVPIETLVDELGNQIPEEGHFDTMRHLTHFILNIAGEMQGWSIIWYGECNPEFIDNSLIKFNINGKLESLTTHNDESYVTTFKQVYGVFKEVFMSKEKTPQLKIYSKQLLENK